MKNKKPVRRVNFRMVGILLLVTVIIGGGVATAHHLRKRTAAHQSLAAGLAAWENRDWAEAARHLNVYLNKYPTDEEILHRYAEAHLAVRPLGPANVAHAIQAYRHLLRLRGPDADISARLAGVYFSNRDYVETIHVCRQRLQHAPDDERAMMWLGRALIAQQKLNDAREELTRFVQEQNQKSVEVYALLSDVAMYAGASGRPEALQWLNQAVEHNPDSADAFVRRARFLSVAEQDRESAFDDMKKAEELGSDDPHVRLLIATEWLRLGELDRAGRELAEVHRIGLDTPSASGLQRDDLALELFKVTKELAIRRGDPEEAAALAHRGLEEFKGVHHVLFLPHAVDLLLAAERLEEAGRMVQEYGRLVADRGPADPGQLEQLALLEGAVSNAEGRYYDTIDRLESVVAASEPREAGIWRHLAYAYSKTGQGRRALAVLERYLSRNPYDWEASLEAARAAYRNSDFENVLKYAIQAEERMAEAVEPRLLRIEAVLKGAGGILSPRQVEALADELEDLRSAHPRRVEIRLLQAMIAYGRGDHEEAMAQLKDAAEQCDRPLPADLQLIELLMVSGQVERALEASQAAIERNPGVAALRIRLAEMQWIQGQQEEALPVLQQAAALSDPQEALEGRYALARSLLSAGREEEAIAILQAIAAERPDDIQPRGRLLEIQSVAADIRRAQRLVDQMRRIEGDRGLRWRLEQARLWLRDEDWRKRQDDVVDLLRRCLDGDPAWTSPVLLLGGVYELLGRERDAEDLYSQYARRHPGQVAVVVRLLELLERQRRFADAARVLDRMPRALAGLSGHRARIAIGQGEYDQAMDQLQERIAADSGDHQSRILLARLVYQHRKDAETALAMLEDVQRAAPDLVSALAARVTLLHAEQRHEEAIALLNAQVERRGDFTSHLMRAEYLAALDDLEAAEQDYRQLITFEEDAARGHAVLGRFFQNTGGADQAIASYRAGLEIEPRNLQLQRLLVGALVFHEKSDAREEGMRLLDQALRELPDDTMFLAIQAGMLLADRHPDSQARAVSIFERIVQIDPRDVNAHLQLIRHATEQGELEQATQLAARAIGSNTDNVNLLLVRAELESELQNYIAARELVRAVLDSDPENPSARNLMVRIALRSGELETAQTLNREALERHPDAEEAQLARADILKAQGQEAEALAHLETFRRRFPEAAGPRTLLVLAEMQRQAGELEACLEALEELEIRVPDHPAALTVRLRVLGTQGRTEDLLRLVKQNLEQRPDDPQPLTAAASILGTSPGGQQALPDLVPLVQAFNSQHPGRLDGHLAMAVAAYYMENLEAAEEAYRRVLAVQPNHRQALNNLAWILSEELDRPEEALALADRGLARHPRDANLLNTRGVIRYRLEQITQARQDLEQCLLFAGDLPATQARTLLMLGRIHMEEGNTEQAAELLNRALNIDRRSGALNEKEQAEIQTLLEQTAQASAAVRPGR